MEGGDVHHETMQNHQIQTIPIVRAGFANRKRSFSS